MAFQNALFQLWILQHIDISNPFDHHISVCHLVNHLFPLPYNFFHFKTKTFCSEILCKIVNSRFSPLRIIHFLKAA